MTDLTILCVTNFGAHAEPFIRQSAEHAATLGARLVVGADGPVPSWMPDAARTVELSSGGYIESVLDQAVAACPDGYILRLDDDERISPQMLSWLASAAYRQADHWAFPRLHLWPDAGQYISNAPLWPDLQTRLSVKAMAGGRHRVHQGSPHGTGRVAWVAIEHHKFLCRPYAERQQLLERYEALQTGAGGELFDMFSLPERYAEHWLVQPVPR